MSNQAEKSIDLQLRALEKGVGSMMYNKMFGRNKPLGKIIIGKRHFASIASGLRIPSNDGFRELWCNHKQFGLISKDTLDSDLETEAKRIFKLYFKYEFDGEFEIKGKTNDK